MNKETTVPGSLVADTYGRVRDRDGQTVLVCKDPKLAQRIVQLLGLLSLAAAQKLVGDKIHGRDFIPGPVALRRVFMFERVNGD